MKFGRGNASARDKGRDDSALGADGLPRIGARLTKGGSVYSIVDETTGIEKVTQHKNEDPALVEQVTVLGTASDKCVGCRAGMSATRAARVVDAPALLAGPSRRST